MIEQSIKAFEFLNTLVDILKSLELYEFINHQKKMEVVESDIYIGEDDLRSELALNITDEDLFVRLKSLSRIDLEALCSIYSLSKMCRNKLLNALKENDYPSFCQVNSKEDVSNLFLLLCLTIVSN